MTLLTPVWLASGLTYERALHWYSKATVNNLQTYKLQTNRLQTCLVKSQLINLLGSGGHIGLFHNCAAVLVQPQTTHTHRSDCVQIKFQYTKIGSRLDWVHGLAPVIPCSKAPWCRVFVVSVAKTNPDQCIVFGEMSLLSWENRQDSCFIFENSFAFSRLLLPYFVLIEIYKVLTFLFPDSFDYGDQVNRIQGFSRFPSVPLCLVWRVPAEYKWDSRQVCGQGEWRTKNKAFKNGVKDTILRAPEGCLSYMMKLPGWLDGTLLYGVTREILQAELMFSSRAQAGLEDSFQQRLFLMLFGCLGSSGLAHPVKTEQVQRENGKLISHSVQIPADG